MNKYEFQKNQCFSMKKYHQTNANFQKSDMPAQK